MTAVNGRAESIICSSRVGSFLFFSLLSLSLSLFAFFCLCTQFVEQQLQSTSNVLTRRVFRRGEGSESRRTLGEHRPPAWRNSRRDCYAPRAHDPGQWYPPPEVTGRRWTNGRLYAEERPRLSLSFYHFFVILHHQTHSLSF